MMFEKSFEEPVGSQKLPVTILAQQDGNGGAYVSIQVGVTKVMLCVGVETTRTTSRVHITEMKL